MSREEKKHGSMTSEENSDAYKHYLKGKYLLETYHLSESYRDGLNRALDFFRQSIDEGPELCSGVYRMARVFHNY